MGSLEFQVRSCPSGGAALRVLREHPGTVRMVLDDLAMPRMDGGEVAERVKDLYPGLPVASWRPQATHRRAICSGLPDLPYLQKPVALGPLAELLLDLLGPPTTPDPHSMGGVVARLRNSDQHRCRDPAPTPEGAAEITPIVLVLRDQPFDDPTYLFEPKYDGFGGLLYLAGRQCHFRSKRGNVLRRFE